MVKKNQVPILLTLVIPFISLFFISSCNQSSTISEISLKPETSLGDGIYRIRGTDSGVDLIWSPRGELLAGLITSSPLPFPDCPPFPPACWLLGGEKKFNSEIFIVDLVTNQRQIIFRTEKNEKIISRIFWLPDGQHIGYLIYDDKGYETGTWSIDNQGQNNVRINNDNDSPRWSHDGSKIAVEEYSGIFLIDASTNQKQQIFEIKNPDSSLYGLSWSHDEKTLAFSYGDRRSEEPEGQPKIYFLELATNEITKLTGDKFDEFTYPEFSPTNNLIAFQRYQPSFFRHTTVIKDLNTDCQIELPLTDVTSVSWSPDGQKLVVSTLSDTYIVDLTEFIGKGFIETGSVCS